MEYLKNWWSSIDRVNIILILSLGFTGLILSFSIDEYLSINRHSIFFIFSIILLFLVSGLDSKNVRRISLAISFFTSLIFQSDKNQSV